MELIEAIKAYILKHKKNWHGCDGDHKLEEAENVEEIE
jgi:hypothetical protein